MNPLADTISSRNRSSRERQRELLEKARREKAEAERKEAERVRKIEQERRDRLVAEAAAWRQAGEIRSYVAAVMGNGKAVGDGRAQEVESWAVWALAESDRIDRLKGERAIRSEAPTEEVPSAD